MTEMTDNEATASTRRELIAFAFVEESYAKSGDIVGGLMPLFAPVLAKRANRIFDSAQFAADVQAAYDIPMSPLVADGLVERFAESGLLRMDGGDQHTYRVAARPGVPTIDEAGVDALLADFCKPLDQTVCHQGTHRNGVSGLYVRRKQIGRAHV